MAAERQSRWMLGAVSPEAAAAFSGMSVTRIRELLYSRKLTYANVPQTRCNLIPVESLIAYLDANAEVHEGDY